jgi:hypothetical protein
VTPLTLPFPTDTAANAYGDSLNITTTIVGDTPHAVALLQSAQGVTLSVVSPAAVDFGTVTAGTVATIDVLVANAGNAAATVTMSAQVASGTGTFTVDGQPSIIIPALQGTQSVAVAFAPGQPGISTGALALAVAPSTALCAPFPAPQLQLTGTGGP